MDAAVRHAMAHADFSRKFKHPIKFNGTDFVETKLSEEEQFNELRRLLSRGSLHVFLERYGGMLESSDLEALGKTPAAETAESKIWLERLGREPPSQTLIQKRARRRRWSWAKREMVEASGFFSEDVMKHRDPRLFHKLIGRHLTSTMRNTEPMKGSLSSYLMQRLDQECEADANRADTGGDVTPPASQAEGAGGATSAQPGVGAEASSEGAPRKKPRTEKDKEDVASDDGSQSEEVMDGEQQAGEEVDVTGRRAQFLKSMRDRFINGKETAFDYGKIDEDSDLDDLTELGQDAEDKYFDADE